MATRYCGIDLFRPENEILEDLEVAGSSSRATEEMKSNMLTDLMRKSYLEGNVPSRPNGPSEEEQLRGYLQMLGELTW